ncbi:hypothetical protein [Lyngbya confervoides]|uniref:Transposase n=1 Tax=Lyngbya confervoides BDU141951 TaxID=1574623 RepID=A0ABD4T3N0_9CYAN|nr:hypothetical protein [Lyngbya confervoides]MCM1983040.1 hypothetical protein [Lyngbya confervoides BDU141951]
MTTCPCCSDTMLRHLSSGRLYWLCQSCKTRMPIETDGLPEVDANFVSALSIQGAVASPPVLQS